MFREKIIQILLSPFALLYGIIVYFIHFFYEVGILKSSSFSVPVIGVGNLSIGGAGKTPHVEYLIEILKDYIDIATLSRGYKRKSSGFRIVQMDDSALTVGDEPIQYRRKYRDIVVAVSESRAYAIPEIIKRFPSIQTILLDDAFQHRTVKPGLNILLTQYALPFTRDYLLPSGRLREWRSGYKRADIIIVTKCPPELTTEKRQALIEEINPKIHQRLFFSYYEYGRPYSFFNTEHRITLDKSYHVILLSAIASTDYVLQYLHPLVQSVFEIEYEDHHTFDSYDIERITKIYGELQNENKIILTTEKDAMRLDPFMKTLFDAKVSVFILPVKVVFHDNDKTLFDNSVKNYLMDFKS
jgi:tetraacyldisaccharide 4'-kinase